MNLGRRIRGVEEGFALTVGDAGPGEPLVEQHRTVGNSVIEFLQGRMAMLSPLVGMPSAHRRDPLACRNVATPCGESFLNLFNRRGVLEDGVITGAIRKTDTVDMRFNQSWDDGAPLKVDDARVWRRLRWRVARRNNATVADGHGTDDRVCRIQGMDSCIDQCQRDIGPHRSRGSRSLAPCLTRKA